MISNGSEFHSWNGLKKYWAFCFLVVLNGSFTLQTRSSCGSLPACSRTCIIVQIHICKVSDLSSSGKFFSFLFSTHLETGWHIPHHAMPLFLSCHYTALHILDYYNHLHSPVADLLFWLQLHIDLCTVMFQVSFRWYNQLRAFQVERIIFLCSLILNLIVIMLTFHLSYLSFFNVLYSHLRSFYMYTT